MSTKYDFSRVKCAFIGVALLFCLGMISCGPEKKTQPQNQNEFSGQVCKTPEKDIIEANKKQVNNEDAEQPATYSGGEEALVKFVKDNIVFPDAEKAKTYKGVIPVRFNVRENGKLGQFTLLETISPECDHALIEAMKKVTGFTAALDKDGKPLSAWWTINIEFPIKK